MSIDAQYETTTPAFSLTTAPTTGNAFPATDPSNLGQRPQAVLLQAETQNIRFTTDGSAPTSSYGMVLVAGETASYFAGPLNALRFIQAASGAVLNVTYLTNVLEAAGPQGSSGAQGAVGPTGSQGAASGPLTLPALEALSVYPTTVASPLDIDDCVLWLDASDATTINAGSPVDDDPVANWADKSASNLDAVQATANNKPVYKTAVQNGLAAIRFDPTDFPQYFGLTGAALAILKNKPGVTVSFACSNNGDDNPVMWMYSGTSTTRDRVQVLTSEENYVAASNDDAVETSSAGVNMHCNGDGEGELNFRERPRAVVIRIQLADQFNVDGVTNFTPNGPSNSFDTPGGTPGNFPNTNSLLFMLGAYIDSIAQLIGSNMDLYELTVWDRCLTQIEMNQEFQRLSTKWGLFV